LFYFTDEYDDKEFQYKVGWTVIMFTIVNVLVNLVVIVKETIGTIKKAWRQLKERWNKRKA